MKIAVDTPVMCPEGYPSSFTRFGVVVAVEGPRARVHWQARELMSEEGKGYAKRVDRRTWVAVSSLSVWPASIRIRLRQERRTLTADGLEYTTPPAA